MSENNQGTENLSKEAGGHFDFDKSVDEVKNFSQLYKLIDGLNRGLVGKDGVVYSSDELKGLVESAIEKTKSSGVVDAVRLLQVSDALAEKFPQLVQQWYEDNAKMELDA